MNDIVKQVKDAAPAYAVLTAACLFVGLVGPGSRTPSFLLPKPKKPATE